MEEYLKLEEKIKMLIVKLTNIEGKMMIYTVEASYNYNPRDTWCWCVELLANSDYDAVFKAVIPRIINGRSIKIINVFAGRNKWGIVE